MGRLVIDGNSVYEIDEECIRRKERQERSQKGRMEKDRMSPHEKGKIRNTRV